MDFVPVNEEQAREMLHESGFSSFDALLNHIKPRLGRELELPHGMDEQALRQRLQELAGSNKIQKYFVGSGSYWHYIPSAVGRITSRAEFYTAYTPYQPELSQGMLQTMYEYQTLICMLTGMDASNASLYDGSTAVPEAANIARYVKGKQNVYAVGLFNHYQKVLDTYANAAGYKVFTEQNLQHGEKTLAAIIVQYPDRNGELIDLKAYRKLADENDALLIVSIGDPTVLGIAKPPSEFGADIVVGDAQAFGNPIGFGGPYVGFMATKTEFMKYMPGRISGKTLDSKGNSGFILTLQAREQHIRRHRAMSNICSNEALCALTATAYLALMGNTGLQAVAKLSLHNAHSLAKKITEAGFRVDNENFYDEFTVSLEGTGIGSSWLITELAKKGFQFGHALGNAKIAVCATEMNSGEQIKELAECLQEII